MENKTKTKFLFFIPRRSLSSATRKKNKKYKKYYGIRAQGFKDNYYNWDNFLQQFHYVV